MAAHSGMPIVIRGPEPQGRRYFTSMPKTLDILLLKAQSLFPVPPGHTPYITLEHDENAVVLEDALPFIRERETLVFRWAPETPRRSTGNRVKWHSDVLSEEKAEGSPKMSSLIRNGVRSTTGQGLSNGGPRQTQSSPSKRDIPGAQSRGQAIRAAHAKRVLEEQRRLREAEEQSQRDENSPTTDGDSGFEGEHSKIVSPTRPNKTNSAKASAHEAQVEACATLGGTHSNIACLETTDLEVSGSSPPPYSSPEDNLVLAVKKLAASQRDTTPDRNAQDVPSSPLAPSPTQNVHAAVAKAAMSPHDMNDNRVLVAGRSPSAGSPSRGAVSDAANDVQLPAPLVPMSSPAQTQPGTIHQPRAPESSDSSPSMPSASAGELSEPSKTSGATHSAKVPQASAHSESSADTYRALETVINTLQSHPSNTVLRSPHSSCLEKWTVVQQKVHNRSYASHSVLQKFRADLDDLWSAARAEHKQNATFLKNVTALEKFASVLLSEWNGTKERFDGSRQSERHSYSVSSNKEQQRKAAAALLASWTTNGTTPAGRGEKRSAAFLNEDNRGPNQHTSAASHKKTKSSLPSNLYGRAPSRKLNIPEAQRRAPTGAVDMSAFHRAMMGSSSRQALTGSKTEAQVSEELPLETKQPAKRPDVICDEPEHQRDAREVDENSGEDGQVSSYPEAVEASVARNVADAMDLDTSTKGAAELERTAAEPTSVTVEAHSAAALESVVPESVIEETSALSSSNFDSCEPTCTTFFSSRPRRSPKSEAAAPADVSLDNAVNAGKEQGATSSAEAAKSLVEDEQEEAAVVDSELLCIASTASPSLITFASAGDGTPAQATAQSRSSEVSSASRSSSPLSQISTPASSAPGTPTQTAKRARRGRAARKGLASDTKAELPGNAPRRGRPPKKQAQGSADPVSDKADADVSTPPVALLTDAPQATVVEIGDEEFEEPQSIAARRGRRTNRPSSKGQATVPAGNAGQRAPGGGRWNSVAAAMLSLLS